MAVVDGFRLLLGVGSLGSLSDRDLLERLATGNAEPVFEVLIARHGPMVLRVCRGVLNDPADAEDAFQATFILLIRRADSLRVRDSIGPWLHGVALRVSKKARVAAARRRAHEGRAIGLSVRDAPEAQAEVAAVVHEELGRLPEKYRVPVVLCHLEGMSHDEAARSLGWPVGTVRGRLFRARDLLRARLGRRGFGPSVVAIGSVLGSGSARAVPYRLINVLIGVTTKVRAGRLSGLVSEAVVRLIKEEGTTVMLTKFKMAGAMLLAGSMVVGAGAMAKPGGGQESKSTPTVVVKDSAPSATGAGGTGNPELDQSIEATVKDLRATIDARLRSWKVQEQTELLREHNSRVQHVHDSQLEPKAKDATIAQHVAALEAGGSQIDAAMAKAKSMILKGLIGPENGQSHGTRANSNAEKSKPATPKANAFDDEAERLFAVIAEGESAAAQAGELAKVDRAEQTALESLLIKYNNGVPKDFDHEMTAEEEKIAEKCEKARHRLEEISKSHNQLVTTAGRAEFAALRLSQLYPGIFPGMGQAAPAQAPSSDHEARLKTLEKKLDRVLDALESLKREQKR